MRFILLCIFLLSALIAQSKEETLNRPSWKSEISEEHREQYEIIYPTQRTGNSQGTKARMGSANALACELEECHFIFHTQMGKLHVYLQLNLMIPNRAGRYEAIYGGTINLFPVWKKKCYYQGVVIGQPGSYVSVSTCQGIRGSIILENATYLITPLKYANLTHYAHAFMRVSRGYGTLSEKAKSVCLRKPYLNPLEAPHAGIGKRLRLSLLVGNDLAEWLKLKPKDLFHFLFEIVNTLDLLLKQIDLRVSIVHAGLWITKSLIDEEQDAILSLADIAQLSMKRKDSFSADVTMLLSAAKFKSTQLAVFTNSICTSNATGLIKIPNKFHPFYTSLLMARSIGHILGVGHDGYSVKQDNKDVSTIMESSHKVELLIRRAYNQIFLYTDCARQDFTALLNTGYGYCLLDLPLEVENNNTAKCGDKVVDENEECDCGTAEECHSIDPCCEPLKCRLKMGAQCSEGPCCDECMFSPKKKICRPSQYDHCDFPEYCNGTSALCPANSYNQDGTPCGPHGKEYCYNGKCQSASGQCREIWGPESSMAHESCFRRSMRGDAFGHCGFDGRGNPKACSPRDYLCGVLFCQGGSASSRELSEYDASNNEDIIECRISLDRSFPWNATLIRDGTKCGANMMCKDQRCIRLPNVEREKKCPTNNVSLTCSGHGTCTNLNTCFCDPGWAETDCSFEVAEREISAEYLVTEQDGNDKQIYSKVFIDKRCAERSGGTLLVAAGCIAVASVVIVLLHFIQIRRHKIFYSPRSLEIWKVQRELLENNLADPIPAGKCCNPKLLRSHDGKSALETEARRIVEGGNCSDGFSVNLSANSTNGCSFDISRGMAKWIRPRLSQIDPSSSSSRRSDGLQHLFSDEHGRSSVYSFSKHVNLTQKHFQLLVGPHDDGISVDHLKSCVKGKVKKHRDHYPVVCPCLATKPAPPADCPCKYLRSHRLLTKRPVRLDCESECRNSASVPNEYSDELSTSCQPNAEVLPAASATSYDKKEISSSSIKQESEGRKDGENASPTFGEEQHDTGRNGKRKVISIFLDEVTFTQ